jgi:hypothetical protein
MNRNRFGGWLKNIYNTQDDEISCSECFELISCFVEIELSGQDPAVKMPKVSHHIHQCAVCREEYEALCELRGFEENGEPMSIEDFRKLIP